MNSTKDVGVFDRFAGWAARAVSRAPFFAFCVLMVVVWAPSIVAIRDVDTWQLIINTATTIVTFLLVALLQNSQARFEESIHFKLDAIATGLRDLMQHSSNQTADGDLLDDVARLERAVGIENDTGTKDKS